MLNGASTANARAAFERALALDANQPRALAGLARLERAAGEREAALESYDRAIAADPTNAASALESAALLVELDRRDDAEKRLQSVLEEFPYDAEAAMALADLRLARGADARELARRAVEFRGGAAAKALLERARSADPESAKAKSAESG